MFNTVFKSYAKTHNSIILYRPKSENKYGSDAHEIVTKSLNGCQNYRPQFQMSGHSYLPNDGDFEVMENAGAKNQYLIITELV